MNSRLPHVVARTLVTRGDEILLLKRANDHSPGTWSAPGGHLEYGESPAAAAVRETWEETRVRIGEPRFRGITNDVFDAAGIHYLTIWMEASFVSGSRASPPRRRCPTSAGIAATRCPSRSS